MKNTKLLNIKFCCCLLSSSSSSSSSSSTSSSSSSSSSYLHPKVSSESEISAKYVKL